MPCVTCLRVITGDLTGLMGDMDSLVEGDTVLGKKEGEFLRRLSKIIFLILNAYIFASSLYPPN